MENSSNIDLGFVEEPSSWQLHPKFFPSKVGGKPAWLDIQDLPNHLQASCKTCNDPLIFLCQIYAPFEERTDTFHRTIFVFICRNNSCCKTHSSQNLLVLRCQLSRKNNVYSYEPSELVEDAEFNMEKWPKLCNVCGLMAPSHCAKCKETYYCCKKHQIIDWKSEHKEICQKMQALSERKSNNFIVTKAGKSILFKEWNIIMHEEDKENTSDVDVNKEMEILGKMMEEKKVGSLSTVSEEELEQFAQNNNKDKVYNKFHKRVAKHHDQILRYERGGCPLWITGNAENSLLNIPKCQYCGGERQFEFQIMPQLLYFINVGIELNSIDWGILAIFTCKQSCNEGPSYKEEYLIKQDISN